MQLRTPTRFVLLVLITVVVGIKSQETCREDLSNDSQESCSSDLSDKKKQRNDVAVVHVSVVSATFRKPYGTILTLDNESHEELRGHLLQNRPALISGPLYENVFTAERIATELEQMSGVVHPLVYPAVDGVEQDRRMTVLEREKWLVRPTERGIHRSDERTSEVPSCQIELSWSDFEKALRGTDGGAFRKNVDPKWGCTITESSVLYLREAFLLNGVLPNQGDRQVYEAFQRLHVVPDIFAKAPDGSGWVLDVANLRIGGVGESGKAYVQEHIDCSHNILYNGGPGEKTMLLLDTESAMTECLYDKEAPLRCVRDLLEVGSLQRRLQRQQEPTFQQTRVLEVTLRKDEALLIPPMWLHSVTYYGASLGFNSFWVNMNDTSTLKCRDLKAIKAVSHYKVLGEAWERQESVDDTLWDEVAKAAISWALYGRGHCSLRNEKYCAWGQQFRKLIWPA